MRKIAVVISLAIMFMSSSKSYSQTHTLYKADSTITTEFYDLYLLLFASGKYYFIFEYNYGKPINDFYKNSQNIDVLPAELLLSYGKYVEMNNELRLKDHSLNFEQVFSIKKNSIVGKKSFEFLNGATLSKIEQPNENCLDNNSLAYVGGVFLEKEYVETYDSLTGKFNKEISNQKNRINNLTNSTDSLKSGTYLNFFDNYCFRFLNSEYEFRLESMLLCKDTYSIEGNKILLNNSINAGTFILRKENDSTFYSLEIPGVFPGTEFYRIKK